MAGKFCLGGGYPNVVLTIIEVSSVDFVLALVTDSNMLSAQHLHESFEPERLAVLRLITCSSLVAKPDRWCGAPSGRNPRSLADWL
jgi:hypothetical protein